MNLYIEPMDKNKPTAKGIEDGFENVIAEVHHLKSTQSLKQKEIDIPMLRSHQKGDRFCKEMVKKIMSRSIKTEFQLDQNGILCRSLFRIFKKVLHATKKGQNKLHMGTT